MGRGPSYPYVDLEQAVALTRKVYDFAKKASAPVAFVVKDAWEYSPTSSSGDKVLAALKAFGLIEDTASGDNKGIKITDAAYRILIDEAASPERKKLLQVAALSPKWYRYCWETWGAEMPPAMKSNLLFEHGFVNSTVEKFLQDYKKSVAYSGLCEKGINQPEDDVSKIKKPPTFAIGDWVQWESQGILQLPAAKKVSGYSDDGNYAFLDGSSTGVPVTQLIAAAPETPPPPPREKGHRLANEGIRMEANTRQDVFSLTEGDVAIQWPASLSKESFQDISDWLEILKRKIGRSVRADG